MAVGRGLALSTKSRLPRLPAGHAHSTSAVQVFCAAQESSRMEGGRSSAAEKLIRGHIAAATTVGGLLLSEASPALAQDAGPAASVAAGAAPALPAIDPAQLSSGVDTAVGTLVDLLRAAGSGIKSGLGGAQDGLEAAESAYSRIAPYVDRAVDAVRPGVEAGVAKAGAAAGPALERALPAAQDALASAASGAGVDLGAVRGALGALGDLAGGVAGGALTAVHVGQGVVSALAAAPGNAGKAALAAAAAWFLLPPALRLLGSGFRGYAGEIAPAAALNELSGWRDGVLVDLRSDREKSVAGVPDLPSAGKLVEVEYAEIGDRRARGALRDPGSLEAEVTAMQVAGLKRAKRGSPIYLLDKNGSVAKTVAKNLARQGFKRVYVVSGGFQGWQNAKLQIKPSSSVSPFDILLPGTGKYSARQTTSTRPQGRRALPSGR
ncbi:hypothetical protein ACKKBG_A33560 [Auxenochlorella protothecoides x Auxenochlorella symbiontica]